MIRLLFIFAALSLMSACQSNPHSPIETVESIDIKRFMGDWYVLANIPTFIETEAYNALEQYELDDEGRVQTTFRFRDGGFDESVKTYHPTGYVRPDTGNAVWGMQFIWPFKAEYRVIYLDADYQTTIIGRTKRDYVWLMARTPDIAPDTYQALVDFIETKGYDSSNLRRIPHRWPDAGIPVPAD